MSQRRHYLDAKGVVKRDDFNQNCLPMLSFIADYNSWGGLRAGGPLSERYTQSPPISPQSTVISLCAYFRLASSVWSSPAMRTIFSSYYFYRASMSGFSKFTFTLLFKVFSNVKGILCSFMLYFFIFASYMIENQKECSIIYLKGLRGGFARRKDTRAQPHSQSRSGPVPAHIFYSFFFRS